MLLLVVVLVLGVAAGLELGGSSPRSRSAASHDRSSVGEQTQAETRALAERMALPVAGKPDSQEMCFVPEADHTAFLAERAPDLARSGQVVDASGLVIGEHS